ncbi:MAG TPA: hypothetical protein VF792_09045 [Ktedonobacterales bacterium]
MRLLRFLRFLQSLPFWPRARPGYFTLGIANGKAAAFQSRTPAPAEFTQVTEQAIFAAAALPGRVAPDDARIYQLGWIEGYHAMKDRVASVAGQ